jgi:hypothetical protein
LVGNASTASTLQTARGINTVSFNGSADIVIPRISSVDNRAIAPSAGTAGYVTFGFGSWANNNTSPYADYFLTRSYTDSSGGSDNLLMLRKDAIGMRLWQQAFGSASAFSSYKDIAWTDGTNASGSWTISITGNAATATTATNVSSGGQINAASATITTITSTSANITTLTGTTFSDGAGNVRNIPSAGADKTSVYTLAITDIGEYVGIGTGGGIDVPNGVFSTGNAISIFNNTTGNRTISLTITTAYIAGTDADKASVTLATRGLATILFLSNSVCVISGNVT